MHHSLARVPAQDTPPHANAMLRSCIVHICGYCGGMDQPRRRLFAGTRVRDLRKQLGLPQAAMAARLGVSVSYLSQIENEERPLTPPVLIALAREFPQTWGDVGEDHNVGDLVRAIEAAWIPASLPH
ncbi:helix-turn-helix domain-containing protein [Ditylenchus destructor]|uniref:Helix-turn-helix domain-containing protein n=1 Tax=Ditylenchus destructor TaxID=166010 RepID=A0AAD4QVP5_9BILA|nr:helix-turn-helix domain-containing protein [Ditylenchus destructor]